MPGRDFLFGFKFLATDYVSPILKNIEGRIESVNAQVKNTARWREAGENIAMAGAPIAAAGGAVALALRSTVNAAGQMQSTIAGVAAVTGLFGSQLDAVREHAESFSEKHFTVSAQQYVEGFGRAYQNLHNVALAQKAVDDAVRAAGATGANYLEVLQLMTVAHENLRVNSTAVADALAATQRQFAIGPEQIQQMTLGIAKLAPSLKAMGGDMTDAFAIAGQAEQLMGGGRGVQMISRLFETLPEIANKAHLNLDKGLFGVLDQIQARIRGYGAKQQIDVLAGMKIDRTMAPEIMRLLGSLDKMRSASEAIKGAGGTILTAAEVQRAATFAAQSELLAHSWENLKETIGYALLPGVTRVAGAMASAVTYVREFATAHPQIVKFAVTFAAIGAAIAIVAGGVLVLAGGLLAAISYIPALAGMGGVGWAIAAGIGLAVNAVGALLAVFPKFRAFTAEAFSAGANLIKALASGIWSAITFPQRAAEAVATKIMSYMPWHSPSEEGPMRYLNRIRIVETMAETIRPGPALAAIRRTAAAIAIAAPMTVAPMISSPAFAARSFAAPAAGGAPIVLNLTVNLDGALGTPELNRQIDALTDRIYDNLERRRKHVERREF
jgi:hypothetical protein